MKNAKWVLIIGIVLGLLTVVLLYFHIDSIQQKQQSEAYFYIGKALPEGAIISQELWDNDVLKVVYFPAGDDFDSLDQVAVKASDESFTWIIGKRVVKDIKRGLLRYDYFTDEPVQRLAAGIQLKNRLMTIPVNQISAAGFFIEPGSRVDIVATYQFAENGNKGGMQEKKRVTKIIQQNVRVLAVGNITTRGAYLETGQYSTVTIEVTPEQAEILVFAMGEAEGGFTLLLRHPANQEIQPVPSVSWDSIK